MHVEVNFTVDAIIIFFVLLQSATPVLCGHKDETGYNEDKVR